MTLIAYPTRVHFADGVLEEALRSEFDAQGYSAPLILGEEEDEDSETSQRIHAGLPRRVTPLQIRIGPSDSKSRTADIVERHTQSSRPDVIIAYGSSRAIAHARKCRQALHQASTRVGDVLPPTDIFAVPGIDGLPSRSRSAFGLGQTLLDAATRTGLPRIIICDPTVTDGSSVEQVAAAAVDALSRSLEAYVSDGYNPPADGMAMDGFIRAISAIKSASAAGQTAYRRELMAASLNATLAQQKGIGPIQLMADALCEPYGSRLLSGAVARILFPAVMVNRDIPQTRGDTLARMLGADEGTALGERLEMLMELLPLPDRLSDLGLTGDDIALASEIVEDSLFESAGKGSSPKTIMESVL